MKILTYLTKEQLEKLSTQRLLAYKNRLMKVHEGPSENNEGSQFRDGCWEDTYLYVKTILSTREHVEK